MKCSPTVPPVLHCIPMRDILMTMCNLRIGVINDDTNTGTGTDTNEDTGTDTNDEMHTNDMTDEEISKVLPLLDYPLKPSWN
jgi:hypothetical protein